MFAGKTGKSRDSGDLDEKISTEIPTQCSRTVPPLRMPQIGVSARPIMPHQQSGADHPQAAAGASWRHPMTPSAPVFFPGMPPVTIVLVIPNCDRCQKHRLHTGSRTGQGAVALPKRSAWREKTRQRGEHWRVLGGAPTCGGRRRSNTD